MPTAYNIRIASLFSGRHLRRDSPDWNDGYQRNSKAAHGGGFYDVQFIRIKITVPVAGRSNTYKLPSRPGRL